MITVLVPDQYRIAGPDPRYLFDINGDEYRFVDSRFGGMVDILITLGWSNRGQSKELCHLHPHRIALDIDVWHGFENQLPVLDQAGYGGNHYVVTVAEHDVTVSNANIIPLQFCFNRTRAYHTGFPWSPGWVPYYWAEGAFSSPRLTDASQRKRIFVAPCRTYFANNPQRQPRARAALANLIRTQYMDRGYLGNVTEQFPLDHLYPQAEFPEMHDFDHNMLDYRHRYKPPLQRSDWHGYSPPHNAYYTNTFVSFYGETIEHGTTTLVSEKTWEPLIKGHFVVPFSNPGFISYLRSLGVRFPDFIDYGYDSIANDDARLVAWLDEIRRLMALDLDQWREHWDANLSEVIHHNKMLVHRRDYHKVDLKRLLSYNSNT